VQGCTRQDAESGLPGAGAAAVKAWSADLLE